MVRFLLALEAAGYLIVILAGALIDPRIGLAVAGVIVVLETREAMRP